MRKLSEILIALVLMVSICMTLVACSGNRQEEKRSANRTIVDMADREVVFPSNIERIACQSSTCEAVIISLGGADLLVGTTDYTEEDSFAYQMFPELTNVAKLADDMSVEEMLEKNVQVVFVKDTNKIEKYEEAGLPVIYVDLDTVDGTKNGIEIIGEVINKQDGASKCVNYINETEELIKERLGNNINPFTAYYSRAKYADSNLMTTYAAGHIYSEWIGLSGGDVITKDMELAETKGGVKINGEELVAANPDVIFIGGYYRNDVYDKAMNGEYKDILGAVANKKVYMVPTSITDWSVGACELGLTNLWCAKLVNSELFDDINMSDEVINFYKNVAGIEVSKELAESILSSTGN